MSLERVILDGSSSLILVGGFLQEFQCVRGVEGTANEKCSRPVVECLVLFFIEIVCACVFGACVIKKSELVSLASHEKLVLGVPSSLHVMRKCRGNGFCSFQ